jgi:hypothetical protein
MVTRKCMHQSGDTPLCACPVFVPRDTPGEDEVNICDGCTHSIAWHSLEPGPPMTNSVKLEEILSTYSTQACASGSASSAAGKKARSKVNVFEARKEAVAGMKKCYDSDEEISPKVCIIVFFGLY